MSGGDGAGRQGDGIWITAAIAVGGDGERAEKKRERMEAAANGGGGSVDGAVREMKRRSWRDTVGGRAGEVKAQDPAMADHHRFSPCSPPASPSLPPSQLAAAAVNLGLFSSVSFSTPQKSSHRHPLCFLTASSPSLLHPRPAASTAFSFDAVLCCRHGLDVAVSPPSSSALISTPSSVLASLAFSEHSRHRDLLPSLLSLSSFVSAAEAVNLLLLCCRASSLLPLPSAAVVVPSPWLRSPPSPLCASPESLAVFLFLSRRCHLPFLHLLRHRQMSPSSSSTVRRPPPPPLHPLGNPPCSSAE